MNKLLELLAANPDRSITFADLERLALVMRYDGPITLHFRGGIARRYEAGRPVQGELVLDTTLASVASS